MNLKKKTNKGDVKQLASFEGVMAKNYLKPLFFTFSTSK